MWLTILKKIKKESKPICSGLDISAKIKLSQYEKLGQSSWRAGDHVPRQTELIRHDQSASIPLRSISADWLLKKLDKLRYLLYTVKKLSGCFSSRSTISFFITVVEFTEIFPQRLDRSVGYELYKKKKMGAFHCFFLAFYLYPFIVQNWIKYAERK